MLTVYVRDGALLQPVQPADQYSCPGGTVWLDLVAPTADEFARACAMSGIALPDAEQRNDLAPSARLTTDNGVLTITVTVAADSESDDPVFGPVTLVLGPQLLVTIRDHDPKFLRIFATRVQSIPHLTINPVDALLDLLETLTGRGADVLAMIGNRIDTVSQTIFQHPRSSHRTANPPEKLSAVLGRIGHVGEFLARLRGGLFDLDRVPAFLLVTLGGRLQKPESARIKTLQRDIAGLIQLAESHSQRTIFLLDATLGLISVEQNHSMRIYTIIATILMAPTLIASTYGMNFKHMPELDVWWAYPLALGCMALSALLPLIWFKRKGWL